MRALEALLLAFDHAWEHKWESLHGALEGVGAEEAAWQAPAYAGAEREDGWPLPGTIHWQVAHVAHCKRHYTELLAQRDGHDRPPEPPGHPHQTFEQELAGLHGAHARQRAAMASLTEADLGTRVGNGMGVIEFLIMCTRHDAWHASQIAVARRLYRERHAARDGRMGAW